MLHSLELEYFSRVYLFLFYGYVYLFLFYVDGWMSALCMTGGYKGDMRTPDPLELDVGAVNRTRDL